MSAQLAPSYAPVIPSHVPCSSEARAVFSTNRTSEKALQDVISVVSDSLREQGQRPLRINSRFTAGSHIVKIKSSDSPRSIVIETMNINRSQHTVYYKQRVPLTAATLGNTTQTRQEHVAILTGPAEKKALHDDIYNWLAPKLDAVTLEKVPALKLPIRRVVQPHEVVAMRINDVRLSVSNSKEMCTLYFDTPTQTAAKLLLPLEAVAKYDHQSLVGLWYVSNVNSEFDIFTPQRFTELFTEVS